MKNNFIIFKNGITTGLFLQLAIGPVFFYITNLTLQRSIYDGLIAVLAVTIVDYLYITISILGIGKLLEKNKIKIILSIFSSIVLIIFGLLTIKSIINNRSSSAAIIGSSNLLGSFLSVLILTISNPITIVFFTSIFTAKMIEFNYTKRELYIFGLSVGSATFIFMSFAVVLFTLVKRNIPLVLIQILNIIVGVVLIGYGLFRIIRILKMRGKNIN